MRKIFKTLIITFVFAMVLPFSVDALSLEIFSIDVTDNDGILTIKGEAEEGVLAVAVVVYKEGVENPVYMQTCAYDDGYNCELTKKFETGTYIVKVADYAGGEYISKSINVETKKVEKQKQEENPKTGDNILTTVIIAGISLFFLIGIGLCIYKKRKLH